jgi:hypothetical protein
MNSRESASLDRHITGNYGEDQFREAYEEDETDKIPGHEWAFLTKTLSDACDYDPTDDGPEVEVIKAIRATHALYTPGKEAHLMKFQRFVDTVARKLFGRRYGVLGLRRKARVMKSVVKLHTADERIVKGGWRLWS